MRDVGSIPRLGRYLEEGMTTQSIVLAWRIPWTEEPGAMALGVTESQTGLKRLSTPAGMSSDDRC